MSTFSRRGFLGASLLGAGSVLGAAGLAGCGSNDAPGTNASGASTLRFWDNRVELQNLQKSWTADFSKKSGIETAFTYTADSTKLIQALQLAQQSNDLPDVYSNVLGLPLAALVADGWVSEITANLDALPEGSVVNGITSLDGKVYGFPLFSPRVYDQATWFHQDLAQQADIDPAAPPETYDEFREACKKIKALGKDFSPVTMGLFQASRVQTFIDDQAQAVGFPGYRGVKYQTGEYAYDDDSYITVIEFWKSLLVDGYVMPGSNTTASGTIRVKWAAGEAVFFFDGTWNPGSLLATAPEALDKLDVGPILRPGTGKINTYRGSPSPAFFISANTKNPEGANKLIESFVTDEYLKALADNMSNPPLVSSEVVEGSASVPAYKRAIGYMKDTVLLAPEPIVRNPEVAKIDAELKPVTPPLGAIVQGYLGGSIPDLKAALKQLNDANNKAREDAMAAAVKKGAKVSMDDYAFANWKPGADYKYS